MVVASLAIGTASVKFHCTDGGTIPPETLVRFAELMPRADTAATTGSKSVDPLAPTDTVNATSLGRRLTERLAVMVSVLDSSWPKTGVTAINKVKSQSFHMRLIPAGIELHRDRARR